MLSQGDNVNQEIINAAKRGVKIRVVQSTPTSTYPDASSKKLSDAGYITLRNISVAKLIGSGILHTKLWIVDGNHFYVGSANMDWRSLTQVKELGLFGRNCSCLAQDALNIFEVYWSLALPGALVSVCSTIVLISVFIRCSHSQGLGYKLCSIDKQRLSSHLAG